MSDLAMVLTAAAVVLLPLWAAMRRCDQPAGQWPVGVAYPGYLHRCVHTGRHRHVDAPDLPVDDAETVALFQSWNDQPQAPTGAGRWDRLGWPVLPEEWRRQRQERNYKTYAANLLASADNVVRVWRDGGPR